jgi:hypothetical protein
MELRIYRCDICHREKGPSNHWFVARVGEAFHIYHWQFWYDRTGEGSDDTIIPLKHLCGQECLQRLLTPFLDMRSTIPVEKETASHATLS